MAAPSPNFNWVVSFPLLASTSDAHRASLGWLSSYREDAKDRLRYTRMLCAISHESIVAGASDSRLVFRISIGETNSPWYSIAEQIALHVDELLASWAESIKVNTMCPAGIPLYDVEALIQDISGTLGVIDHVKKNCPCIKRIYNDIQCASIRIFADERRWMKLRAMALCLVVCYYLPKSQPKEWRSEIIALCRDELEEEGETPIKLSKLATDVCLAYDLKHSGSFKESAKLFSRLQSSYKYVPSMDVSSFINAAVNSDDNTEGIDITARKYKQFSDLPYFKCGITPPSAGNITEA